MFEKIWIMQYTTMFIRKYVDPLIWYCFYTSFGEVKFKKVRARKNDKL